MEDMEKPD
jgi:Bardet-Biedl syndrome 4 protein